MGPIEAEKIKSIRKSLQLTQESFAKKLGVTKITVARWESGERACKSAHAENVIKLEQTKYNNIIPWTTTIFSVRHEDLSRMESKEATQAVRDLLWCKCGRSGIPISDTDMCEAEIKDGGIDLRINAKISTPIDDILPGLNCFQVKSGKSKNFSTKKNVREILFGSGKDPEISLTKLGTEVQKCLKANGRYVLICCGIDMTGKQISDCEDHFKDFFKECGYLNAKVEIWAQQKLIGMFSSFPSLCLRITGRDELHFKDYCSWKMEDNMQKKFHISQDTEILVQEIRTHLRKSDPCHIRLIGPSGIGKTRLVLEVLSSPDLAPLVVYISDSEDFKKNLLFNKLCRFDAEYFVILVLDDCSAQQCKEIWNSLRSRANRCKIISIDQRDYKTSDSLEHVFECPSLAQDKIEEIIQGYIQEDIKKNHDFTRWSTLLEGYPLMAHLFGKNLRQCPDDLFREPSTTLIWEKFIIGGSSSEDSENRQIILEYLSLFQRFGFEEPNQEEREFIFQLIKKENPHITSRKFQSIVEILKKEYILKGKATLRITPKPLHCYLYRCFWEKNRGFFSTNLIETMPSQLASWFWQMSCYAHLSLIATQEIKQVLDPEKPLYTSEIFTSKESEMLNELSSAFPDMVLEYIETKTKKLTQEKLLSFRKGRQELVWALEKIIWRKKLFYKATKTLLKFAEAENANNSNNSKGIFIRLFSLTPGSAPTEASFSERLKILTEILDTSYELGLEACEEALSTGSKVRLIGSEYQGLQQTFSPWCAESWEEVWEQYKMVWNLLFTSTRSRNIKDRAKANFILLKSARRLLKFEWIQETIVITLNELVDDEATDMNYLLYILTGLTRRRIEGLSSALVNNLKTIERKITGTTFSSRVKRWVLLATYNDNINKYQEDKNDGEGIQQIKQLALEAVEDHNAFNAELSNLVLGKNSAIFEFGKCIGKLDKNRNFFTSIKNAYLQNALKATAFLLSGYLKSIFDSSPKEWEIIVDELTENSGFYKFIGELIRESGFTDSSIQKLFFHYENGRLDINCLLCICCSSKLKFLKSKNIQKLLECLLEKNKSIDALKVLRRIYCGNKKPYKLPKELTLQILKEVSISDNSDAICDYEWNMVAKVFILQFPEKSYDVFESILERLCKITSPFRSSEILQKIINFDRERCWFILASKIDALEHNSRLQFIYRCKSQGVKLSLFRLRCILNWIAEKPKIRAPIIADMASPVLKEDPSECLVRELLNRYGEQVEKNLLFNFCSGSWMGSESMHFQNKYHIANQWLEKETSMRVREWLEKYISVLSKRTVLAEIEEERY